MSRAKGVLHPDSLIKNVIKLMRFPLNLMTFQDNEGQPIIIQRHKQYRQFDPQRIRFLV